MKTLWKIFSITKSKTKTKRKKIGDEAYTIKHFLKFIVFFKKALSFNRRTKILIKQFGKRITLLKIQIQQLRLVACLFLGNLCM